MLEKLEKLGNRYNSSIEKIGELLAELAEEIDERLPEEMGNIKFKAHGILYWRYGPRSNLAHLGPGFWIDGELVSTTRTPGSSFYLHNDFSCLIRVADRTTRREAARKIRNWMDEFIQFLEKASSEAEEEAQTVEEVLKNFKEK